MKVKALRHFVYDGRVVEAGEELDAREDGILVMLLNTRKVEPVREEQRKAEVRAPRKAVKE